MSDDRYLVPAAEIEAMEGLEKTHFLNPDARRVNRSLGDLTGLTGLGIHLIEVAPGAETTEYHVHHHEDEAVYVLSGRATAEIGEEAHAIGPGDFIGYRRGGLAHTIRNTGEESLRLLVIGQRLDHDIGDYPRQGRRIIRDRALPSVLVEHAALQEVTVGRKR